MSRGTDENHRDSNQKNTAIVIYAVVRQRLRYNKLEENGTGKTVLDVIKSGYKILVKTNNSSIELNGYRKSPKCKFFMEAKNRTSERRLVLDCKHINPHLNKFKLDTQQNKCLGSEILCLLLT